MPERVIEWGLGPGESAVIGAVLGGAGGTAILDDAEARTCARTLRIPVMGTLGVVLRAKRLGRIPSASDVLHRLRRAGLFLDDSIVRQALWDAVGEPWEP